MSQLPIQEAIPRFKANEERVDNFVNGAGYYNDQGVFVPGLGRYNNRGAWQASTAYIVYDLVLQAGNYYLCKIAHTSTGSFDSSKWVVYQGVTSFELGQTTGGALVGVDDGASGANYDNIAEFLTYLRGTNGTKTVGHDGVTIADYFKTNLNRVVDSIVSLKALDKTKYTKALVTSYFAGFAGVASNYHMDATDTTTADNGSTVIVATDGGRWKLQLNGDLSLMQCGAKGDNSANDTAAIANANAYIAATGRNVFVNPGIYLVDPFSIAPAAYGSQGNFYGNDRERTVIKRRTAGAGAFITVGSSAGTIFQAGLVFKGFTIDGGVTTNGNALVCYDLVRSRFENMNFSGGAHAVQMFGGISVTFDGCLFNNAKRGIQVEKFTSSAGGGWPNIIRIVNSEIVDNAEWGVWFDNGRMLILDNTEVEGNGTTLAASEGGVFIGSNIGEEVIGSDTFSIGLIMCGGSWVEANKGEADIVLNSGINTLENVNFFSTSVQTTNDVKINGGRYTLKNCNSSFSKTANVLENSGSITGNVIDSCDFANLSHNPAKTMVFGGNKISLRGGVVPIYAGLNIPFEQFGNNNTAAGSTVNINFPVPFAAIPKVFPVVHNGDSSTDLLQIVISNITTNGFTARCLSLTSGSSTISSVSAGFNWRAVGTL